MPIDPAPGSSLAPGPVGGGAAPPPPRSNSQAHLFNSSASASPAPVMMGTSQPQQQQQNPFLRDMLNSNPSFGGTAPAPHSTQPAAAQAARPSVPSQSNQVCWWQSLIFSASFFIYAIRGHLHFFIMRVQKDFFDFEL